MQDILFKNGSKITIPDKPKTILFDADDTLYDMLPLFVFEYNRLTGENFKLEDIDGWNLEKKLNQPQYVDIIFRDPDFFERLPLKPHAKELLERLNNNHFVYIVTAGRVSCLEGKERAFKRDFPFLSEKQFVYGWVKGLYKGDILVDDGIHFHKQFQETNPNGLSIVMDMPHNRFCNIPHIRATDLAEVGTIISLYLKNT